MKKFEHVTPEMEIVELKAKTALLASSGDGEGTMKEGGGLAPGLEVDD